MCVYVCVFVCMCVCGGGGDMRESEREKEREIMCVGLRGCIRACLHACMCVRGSSCSLDKLNGSSTLLPRMERTFHCTFQSGYLTLFYGEGTAAGLR